MGSLAFLKKMYLQLLGYGSYTFLRLIILVLLFLFVTSTSYHLTKSVKLARFYDDHLDNGEIKSLIYICLIVSACFSFKNNLQHHPTKLVILVRLHDNHLDNGFPTARSEDRAFPPLVGYGFPTLRNNVRSFRRLVGYENIKSSNIQLLDCLCLFYSK